MEPARRRAQRAEPEAGDVRACVRRRGARAAMPRDQRAQERAQRVQADRAGAR